MAHSVRTSMKPVGLTLAALLLAGITITPSAQGEQTASDNPRAQNLNLLDAAKNGDAILVASVLNTGASVSTRDRFGNTALIYAARGGHTQTVRILIEAGADTLQSGVGGNSPLFEAAGSGQVEIVRLLLDLGSDPNTANVKRVSPLANAVFHKHGDVADLLLQQGARPHIIDSTGKSSAVYAAANGETAILQRILMSNRDKSSIIDRRYTHELTLLMWAAGYGNLDTVKMLIEVGANIDLTDDRGKTAFAIAVDNEHDDTVAALRDLGANSVSSPN